MDRGVLVDLDVMKGNIFVLLVFAWTVKAYSQEDAGIHMMVTLSGMDTLEIQRFDKDQNKVFDKIFPSYGVSQILAWQYAGDTLRSYTWSHSNAGFIENEYEWNRTKDTAKVYSYELDGHEAPQNLMDYFSIEALKGSKEFKNYIQNGKRFLKATQYFGNGVLLEELEFSPRSNPDTVRYSYSGNLLTRRKEIYGHNGGYNEVIYEYDGSGNEIRWMKVFDSIDTSVVYSKTYKDGLLREVIAEERGAIASRKSYHYEDGRLKSTKQVDSKGDEKMTADYSYREDGKTDHVDEVNRYMGQVKRTYYFY